MIENIYLALNFKGFCIIYMIKIDLKCLHIIYFEIFYICQYQKFNNKNKYTEETKYLLLIYLALLWGHKIYIKWSSVF